MSGNATYQAQGTFWSYPRFFHVKISLEQNIFDLLARACSGTNSLG